MAFCIDDGYTITRTIESAGLTFSFRPPTRRELRAFVDKMEQFATDDERREFSYDDLMARLKSWNVTTKDGAAVPISVESLDDLPVPLFRAIDSAVYNSDPEKAAKN